MPRRSNRLIFLILTLSAFTLYWGCSQPEDVISDVTTSKLTLTVERLPSLPEGMVYELWVTTGGSSPTNVSLGYFSYDQEFRRFLEPGDSTVRSNEFFLSDDIFKFATLFVSVENWPDAIPCAPGPIMLQDAITDPTADEIELRFQNASTNTEIGDATVRFNMEAVTDLSRNSNDGHGLWFTSYQAVNMDFPDTTQIWPSFDSIDLGTLELEIRYNNQAESVGVDTTNKDEIFVDGFTYFEGDKVLADSAFDTTLIVFGSDTIHLDTLPLLHLGYRMSFAVDVVHEDDTADANGHYWGLDVVYDSINTTPRSIPLDIFSQDEFGLPDYGSGWKYKGWIVTPYYTNEVSARLTPPAWTYQTGGFSLIPGDTGALFTTGTFTNINAPDDANPYNRIDDDFLPKYPGEDFLDMAALNDSFGLSSINFMPLGLGNEGTVFITLEPTNFKSDSNFPLFVFIKALPTSRNDIRGSLVQITMDNWTHTVETEPTGFPQISVGVQRF